MQNDPEFEVTSLRTEFPHHRVLVYCARQFRAQKFRDFADVPLRPLVMFAAQFRHICTDPNCPGGRIERSNRAKAERPIARAGFYRPGHGFDAVECICGDKQGSNPNCNHCHVPPRMDALIERIAEVLLLRDIAKLGDRAAIDLIKEVINKS